MKLHRNIIDFAIFIKVTDPVAVYEEKKNRGHSGKFVQVLRAWLPEVRGGGLECIKAVVKSSLKAISLESRR